MRLAEEAWSRVTSRTVFNCWRHVGILSPRDPTGAVLPEAQASPASQPKKKTQEKKPLNDPDVATAVKELNTAIKDLAKRSIAPARVMDAEEMLRQDNGETEGTLDDEEIMAQVLKDRRTAAARDTGESEIDSDDEPEETPNPVITAAEGMRYLRELARLCDTQSGQEFRDASKLIPKLLRKLNMSAQEGKTQSRMTDFFIEWPKSP